MSYSHPVSGHPPPGVFRRFGALVYDGVLLLGVWFVATLGVLPLRGGEAFHPHDPVFFGYLLLVGFLFNGWFWTHGGQTLGMCAWRIRVVAEDGGAVSWRQAAVRYVCSWLALGLGGLGYFWIWIEPGRRAWHDLLSGTRVIRVARDEA